jgi:hypothetical protein
MKTLEEARYLKVVRQILSDMDESARHIQSGGKMKDDPVARRWLDNYNAREARGGGVVVVLDARKRKRNNPDLG